MSVPAPLSGRMPPGTARRAAWLRRMAWLCAVLVLAIIGLSAQMRLTRVGLGCEPWPQCYGGLAQAPGAGPGSAAAPVATGPGPTGASAVRLSHRVAASAALLVVLGMLAVALGRRPFLWAEGRLALGLLGLALFLAVLGRSAGPSGLPAVTLGNLLGGFLMIALSARLAWTAARPSADGGRRTAGKGAWPARRWTRIAILLVLVQVALGGLVSSGHAGLSCPAFGACDLGAGSLQAFNPWIELPPGTPPTHGGGAWLHMAHRAVGLALAVLLLALSWRAWRRGARAVAAALAGLPILLVALGFGLVALDLPLGLVLAHNLCAALLIALLAGAPGGYSSLELDRGAAPVSGA